MPSKPSVASGHFKVYFGVYFEIYFGVYFGVYLWACVWVYHSEGITFNIIATKGQQISMNNNNYKQIITSG